MDFKEVIFITIFTLIALVASYILHRLADSNYIRLVSWSIKVYIISLIVNIIVTFLKLFNTGDYNNPKEYIFVGIDVIILVLLTLIRLILQMKKDRISNGEQQLMTSLTLLSVFIPLLNIGYIIDWLI